LAERGRAKRRILRRGAVLVEYALLLTFFALPVCAGMVLAGDKMLKGYRAQREEILQPWP